MKILFHWNQIPISELPMKFKRGGIICLGRLYRRWKVFAELHLSIYKEFCPPRVLSGVLKEKHPLVAGLVSSLTSRIPIILRSRHKSEIFPSVVQAVMVYVVDLFSWTLTHNEFVHDDESGCPFPTTSAHVGNRIPTPALMRCAPLKRAHNPCISIINYRGLLLGQCYYNHGFILT